MNKSGLNVDGSLVVTITVSKSTVTTDGTDVANYELTLSNCSNQPVASESCTWTTNFGALGSQNFTTDDKGKATVTLKSTTLGKAIVQATVAGNTASAPEATFKNATMTLVITVDKNTAQANSINTAACMAIIQDGTTGEGVPGVHVRWDTDFGNISQSESITDTDGQAKTMLTNASAGSAVVAASTEGMTVSAPKIEFTQVQLYPAPHLRESTGGNISTPDIGVTIVHVDIPASAVVAEGDSIRLSWAGTLPDGSDGPQYLPSHEVTASEPGNSIAFEVPVADYLMPYANGGELALSYTVNGQPSDEERITVDYMAPPLAAPVVDQAEDGLLLPQGLDEVTLTVPAWDSMTAGDQVIYTWQGTTADGEVPDPLSDDISVPSVMVGYPVSFSLDATEAALPFDGGSLEVWYQVTPADGSPVLSSLHQTYPVGYPAKLPLPLVEESTGNVIDPDAVDTSAHVLITYPDMASGDVVQLLWQPYIEDGSVGDSCTPAPHIVSRNDVSQGRVRLAVPEAYLNPYLNGRVEVSYTVVRNGETEEKASEVASYEAHAVVARTEGARHSVSASHGTTAAQPDSLFFRKKTERQYSRESTSMAIAEDVLSLFREEIPGYLDKHWKEVPLKLDSDLFDCPCDDLEDAINKFQKKFDVNLDSVNWSLYFPWEHTPLLKRWFRLKREEVEANRLPLTVIMFAKSAAAGKWLFD